MVEFVSQCVIHSIFLLKENPMRRPKQLSLDDSRWTTGRGGPRRGSGRPARRKDVRIVHHVRRDPLPGRYPVHITLRVQEDVPSLRNRDLVREFRRSLAKAAERGNFRVVHYSLQRNRLHLIVEAANRVALGSGMKSVSARLARAVNRVFQRRGTVLEGRYHLHVLKTPREVRHAVAYVLLNVRKHWKQRYGKAPPVRLDAASSGRWFEGWKWSPRGPTAEGPCEVATPKSWLLVTGWRRHGLIDPAEVPGGAR